MEYKSSGNIICGKTDDFDFNFLTKIGGYICSKKNYYPEMPQIISATDGKEISSAMELIISGAIALSGGHVIRLQNTPVAVFDFAFSLLNSDIGIYLSSEEDSYSIRIRPENVSVFSDEEFKSFNLNHECKKGKVSSYLNAIERYLNQK